MEEKFKITEEDKDLLEWAIKAMKNAYVLWGFAVGAAVLAEDNVVYEGCNIESWVSGLGKCAERCAIDHAVLHGNRKIRKIAIVTEMDNIKELIPCGACLQYISDFAFPEAKILMAKTKNGKLLMNSINVKTIEELFPFSYRR
ncbi:MAG: cytidine deaminase [Candidatus Bathyarchaeia archaeon]